MKKRNFVNNTYIFYRIPNRNIFIIYKISFFHLSIFHSFNRFLAMVYTYLFIILVVLQSIYTKSLGPQSLPTNWWRVDKARTSLWPWVLLPAHKVLDARSAYLIVLGGRSLSWLQEQFFYPPVWWHASSWQACTTTTTHTTT